MLEFPLISKQERKYLGKIQMLRDSIFDALQSKAKPIEYLTLSDEELYEKLCITLDDVYALTAKIFKLNPKRKITKTKVLEIFNGNDDPLSFQNRYKFGQEIKNWLSSNLLEYKNLDEFSNPTTLCYTINAIPSVRNDVILGAIHSEIMLGFYSGNVRRASISQNIQYLFGLDIGKPEDKLLWESKLNNKFNNIYIALINSGRD